jgi:hypothetical protein
MKEGLGIHGIALSLPTDLDGEYSKSRFRFGRFSKGGVTALLDCRGSFP